MMQTTRSPQRAARLFAWGACCLLAGLAWIPTIGQAQGMASIPGTMGLSLFPFLGFWTLMMAAMMLPSLAPRLSLHLETVRLLTRSPLLVIPTGGVVLGYLVIWAACGVPIYGLAEGEGFLVLTAPTIAREVGAIVLLAVGLYQLTPLKAACLASCQPSQAQQLHQMPIPTVLREVRIGIAHGLACVSACGGLMLLLVVVGLMNLTWMMAITLIVVLEKGWSHGCHLAQVVGVGLLVLGILAAGAPGLVLGTMLAALH